MRLITFLFAFVAFNSIGQISFSFNTVETCLWSERTSSFSICGEQYVDNSLLKVNKAETMFTHITEDMTSTYYVISTEHIDGYYQYSVESDVGNEYEFILDVEKELFKILGTNANGDIFLTMYHIKAAF